MVAQSRVALQLSLFLAAFFAIWTLRATVFFSVDESIASPVSRAAYSDLMKLAIWVLPAAAFAGWIRHASPAEYLGLSVWPSRERWMSCLSVIAVFLLVVALVDLNLERKSPSVDRLLSLPVALWILQLLLSPLLEEILFRGFILKELLAVLPEYRAIALTSVLFVGIHLPFWIPHRGLNPSLAMSAFGIFAFSVVAGWTYARTGSIWPPTLAHVANNVLVGFMVPGNI